MAAPRRLLVTLAVGFALPVTPVMASGSIPLPRPLDLGAGFLLGATPTAHQAALALENQLHDPHQYGYAESRVDLGPDVGLSMASSNGVTLLGIPFGNGLTLQFGAEALSGRIFLHSADWKSSYYEYLPTASLGLEWKQGDCRLLPMLRSGAAIGTLDRPGILPELGRAYGTGLYYTCSSFNVAAEWLRIDRDGHTSDLPIFDAAFKLPAFPVSLGIRGEARLPQAGSAELPEHRFMFMIRTGDWG